MSPPPADPHRDIPNFIYLDDGWDEPLDGPVEVYDPWQHMIERMEYYHLEGIPELEEYEFNDNEYEHDYINNYACVSMDNSDSDENEEEDDTDWQNGCTDPNGVMLDLNPIVEETLDETKNSETKTIDWDKLREEWYLQKGGWYR